MHEHDIRANPLAVADTLVTCLLTAWFIGAEADHYAGYYALLVCAAYTALIVGHYFPQGIAVCILELASFYVSISYLDILTGRVPHDRIHPQIGHSHDCPTCSHPPESYRIKGFWDAVGYVLVAIPMIFTTFPVKASALFFGPLLYVGFGFRAPDYADLSLAARHTYRSSFKSVGIVIAIVGIALFLCKVVLYSYWNILASWWAHQPLLSAFSSVIRPAAFLPFHLTGVCNSVLLLVSIYFVDLAIHNLEDKGLSPHQISGTLRTISVLTRIRTVLSIYTWVCFLWLFLPWLRNFHFPPVSFELFPKA